MLDSYERLTFIFGVKFEWWTRAAPEQIKKRVQVCEGYRGRVNKIYFIGSGLPTLTVG